MKKNAKIQIITVAILVGAILVLINFLSHRYPLRWDLTEDREYTLSEATKKILKNLDDPVHIKLYFTEKVPPNLVPIHQRILDLLQEYRAVSHDKIRIEHIVPESSPEKEMETEQLGIPPLQLNVIEKDKQEVRKVYLGMVILYGDRKEVLPVVANLQNLEYDITSLLLKLTSKQVPRLGLVTPEAGGPVPDQYELLKKVLQQQVALQPINSTEELVSGSFDALLVVEPQNKDKAFQAKLENLFASGLPLILFSGRVSVDNNMGVTPLVSGLEGWLEEKGISFSQELVVDPAYSGRATFSTGVVQYNVPYPFFIQLPREALKQDHVITSMLEGLLFPWTNALIWNGEKHPDWKFTVLAESSPDSFLQEGEPKVMPQDMEHLKAQPGSQQLLAGVVEAPRAEGNPSRLIVIANANFARNGFLTDHETNVLFIQNMIDWLTWGDDLIGIRSRGKTDRPLKPLAAETAATIRWVHLLGIPLIVVAFGFTLYGLRKRSWKKKQAELLGTTEDQ